MPQHAAFQKTMLPFFVSVPGLCVCWKLSLFSVHNSIKSSVIRHYKLSSYVCLLSLRILRRMTSLHHCTMTHQKQLLTERSNPREGELCSWKILPHQKIYQEHRGVFYKWTRSQDRNQDDTNEAEKGETKWKWNKVSTGWNIMYSHYLFTSYKDYACALTY